MNKYTLASVTLIVIVGLTSWVIYFLSSTHHIVLPKKKSHTPDAWMEDVKTLIMNKQGMPKLRIVSPRMLHFDEKNTTELLSPRVTFYRNSTFPWLVTAKYARATEGTENVDFRNDVIIHHSADDKHPETWIKTARLLVHPDKETAETTYPITLIQPNLKITSVGLFADLHNGDIKLTSQMRGEYVPDS